MTKTDWIESIDLAARIAVLAFALTVCMIFVVAGPKLAEAATLRGDTIITGEYIRLGDIFDGAKNADYVLGPAPAPGKEMILNAKTLYRISSALNVDWKPRSAAEQVILRREASILPQSEITAELEKKIHENGVEDKFSISYLTAPSDIVLPGGTEQTLDITAFSFDPQADMFNAVIVAPSADNPLKRVSVTGRIERQIAVPVLANALRNGDIIGANDLDWIDIPRSRIANGTALTEADLIDMTPRRTIPAGKPVLLNEIIQPQMVERGDAVTLVFETGAMMLTARGKALQSGAIGDTVRVANTDSNKNLQGVVTAHREITIR